MKGARIIYSREEIAWLDANRTMVIGEYHRGFQALFARPDVSTVNLSSLRKRKGWRTGRTGQFVNGATSHNKGKACPPGTGGRHPNARRTQFKKGGLPRNYRGPGHEWEVGTDGYVVMIVGEKNPHTGADTRPVQKHRYLWEQANNPVPEGYVLKCLDGNKTNCDPSNWEAIPRAILPRLNGRFGMNYDQASIDIKPIIMNIAKLKHAVAEAGARRLAAARRGDGAYGKDRKA